MVEELQEANLKLQEEVNVTKSLNLVANFKVEEEKTNFQNEKLECEGEKKKLEEEKLALQNENRG